MTQLAAMISRLITVPALILVAGLAACTTVSSQADWLFETGEYAQAAKAYESYLESDPDPGPKTSRALYRLGLTYASTEASSYDPQKAAELLKELLEQDPDGIYSLGASVLLGLQEEVLHLRDEVASRRDLVQSLVAEHSGLRQELERVEGEAGEKDEAVQDLSARIQRLESEIGRLKSDLAQRVEELERLKAIDLETPP